MNDQHRARLGELGFDEETIEAIVQHVEEKGLPWTDILGNTQDLTRCRSGCLVSKLLNDEGTEEEKQERYEACCEDCEDTYGNRA